MEMTIPLVPVSFRIPEDLYWRLKRLARREAVLRDVDLSMADLVREALIEKFGDLSVDDLEESGL